MSCDEMSPSAEPKRAMDFGARSSMMEFFRLADLSKFTKCISCDIQIGCKKQTLSCRPTHHLQQNEHLQANT